MAKADRFQARRQQMAERYLRELSDLPLILPPLIQNPATDLHSWHLFCIQLTTDKISRNDFIQKMSDNGIGTSVHFIPFFLQPYWKEHYQLDAKDYPNSDKYFSRAVSLPIYTKMTDADQARVINSIRNIFIGLGY